MAKHDWQYQRSPWPMWNFRKVRAHKKSSQVSPTNISNPPLSSVGTWYCRTNAREWIKKVNCHRNWLRHQMACSTSYQGTQGKQYPKIHWQGNHRQIRIPQDVNNQWRPWTCWRRHLHILDKEWYPAYVQQPIPSSIQRLSRKTQRSPHQSPQ